MGIQNRWSKGTLKPFSLNPKPDVPAEDKDDTIMVILPYVKGVSEAMRQILACVNIQTTFRPFSTLKQHLVKPKVF